METTERGLFPITLVEQGKEKRGTSFTASELPFYTLLASGTPDA